jgi:hypothetical protein
VKVLQEDCSPDGVVRWRLLGRASERVLIRYSEGGQAVSEHITVGTGETEGYSSHTEYEYEGERLARCRSSNSLGETRTAEYNSWGKLTIETVNLKRAGQPDYSSTTRFEYDEEGRLILKLYEDCLGEKRKIQYDQQGRKSIEDIRVSGVGHSGYAARTEYAYATDDVHFQKHD